MSEKLVFNAAGEANARNYTHLYVVGFAIQPNAREMVENADSALGIPATYVQMTPDLMMGDLLKNLRSSQIFSVCGLPDVEVVKVKKGQARPRALRRPARRPRHLRPGHERGGRARGERRALLDARHRLQLRSIG